ncbi:hypothetical protein [Streptomyces sp. NPDC048224]|uniref:hypothetical protein n=1 Tax=Streptomyces sp. NPDC048224 TaxID=3154500 RepID=UPI0033C357B0
MEKSAERPVVATEADEQARQPAATATAAASGPSERSREEAAADRVTADGARLRAFAWWSRRD